MFGPKFADEWAVPVHLMASWGDSEAAGGFCQQVNFKQNIWSTKTLGCIDGLAERLRIAG
jgi:hypothetical protein